MTSSSFSRRALVSAALSGAALAAAGIPTRAAASTAVAVPPLDTQALRAAISDLDHPQVTAAQVRVSGSAGSWYGTSGVAEIRTGRPVGADDTFRIGSITKVFVATVVLQLIAERRVDLNTPIQRYLPGLLPAAFAPIMVSQLLNHTSGLPNESGPDVPDLSTPEGVFQHRFDQWTPDRLVATVTRLPMKFAPGTRQEYRGVNYILLAMLIEKVTGHPYSDEITARFLRPLGMKHTVVPGNDTRIHGPHVHGYLAMTDGTLRDITVVNPSDSWGEGEMISTSGDLDRLVSALFSGALLPPHLLRKMFALPPEDVLMLDGTPARYSTGLQTVTLNGITFWGKTGEQYGYANGMFSTRDQQRRIIFAFNPTHRDATQQQMTLRIAQAATNAP
ncbi:serine hydrolase domain-containing protein [Actinacidiphila oryziradicis]|uniref:serine hydrolase domain-containing protein n=1 Tax=Actinacidiphila oryziradicis TaxID=2571141 RepID=UPI0023F21CC8|nr:serine hydrolase domain-containing protein [Actinacidiphila oryziradicis]